MQCERELYQLKMQQLLPFLTPIAPSLPGYEVWKHPESWVALSLPLHCSSISLLTLDVPSRSLSRQVKRMDYKTDPNNFFCALKSMNSLHSALCLWAQCVLGNMVELTWPVMSCHTQSAISFLVPSNSSKYSLWRPALDCKLLLPCNTLSQFGSVIVSDCWEWYVAYMNSRRRYLPAFV